MSKLNDGDGGNRIFAAQLGIMSMNGRKRRFLIVENEYLIAIDVGGLLAQIFDGEVSTCTKSEFSGRVVDGAWDLVVLDTAGSDVDAANAKRALTEGAAIIFLSAYEHLTPGVPGFQDWPVVMKPFSTQSLSEAVVIALIRIGKL